LRTTFVFRRSARLAVEQGAECFRINSLRLSHFQRPTFKVLALARAVETNASFWQIESGTDDGVTFCGTSAAIDPYGVIVAAASADREELIQAEISEEVIKSVPQPYGGLRSSSRLPVRLGDSTIGVMLCVFAIIIDAKTRRAA